MKRKIFTAEQIVKKLRQADALLASGSTIENVCKQLGIIAAKFNLLLNNFPRLYQNCDKFFEKIF